jgi:murein DD-endopeptidase MepM/ murein hydrolase activator NlpD
MSARFHSAPFTALLTVLAACSTNSVSPGDSEVCTGYADWQSSSYVLPYSAGKTFKVIQGNCSAPGNGHRGVQRYGYDFDMGIGTQFVAARAGVVAAVEESHVDGQVGDSGLDNYIAVRHTDGTVAIYGHITHDGAIVSVGDVVQQGATLGMSGNTGNTNNIPHLHLSVHSCDPVTGGSAACPSIPVTFRNTEANPQGLQVGQNYTAAAIGA